MPAEFLPIIYVEGTTADAEALKLAFAQTRVPNELIILPDGLQARDYFEAVLLGRRAFPSLALIHLNIPKLDGLGLLRWMREQPLLKVIPIVALSAEYNFHDLEKAYDFGANLYLLKPKEIRQWSDLVFRLQGYWGTQSDPPQGIKRS